VHRRETLLIRSIRYSNF